ncbi:Hypothetical predicted protein [Cloeon dipterum]|uniref:Uncharacterized protein n=1 Tax=Cloeon dipterum TaxID=197152 RepID=A0A8S1CW47_9INSE|nr:Hypothetical predicted protein [Cloeon dipterum]
MIIYILKVLNSPSTENENSRNKRPSGGHEGSKFLSIEVLSLDQFERSGINAERLKEEEQTMGFGFSSENSHEDHEHKESSGRCAEELGISIDRFGDTIFYFWRHAKYSVQLNWFPAAHICKVQSQSESVHDESKHKNMRETEKSMFGSSEGNNTFFLTGMMDLSSDGVYALEINDETLFQPWPDATPLGDPTSCPANEKTTLSKNCARRNGKILCGVTHVCDPH